MPVVQNKSLMPSGRPSSGPPSPFANRASDARAMSRARSGVSSTKALSARAFSMAARCASASSSAENPFCATRRAPAPSVSAVRSLIRPWDRRRKMDYSPPASALAMLSPPTSRPLAGRLRRRRVPLGLHRQRLHRKSRKQRIDGGWIVRLQQDPGCRDKRARSRLVHRRGTVIPPPSAPRRSGAHARAHWR